MLILDEILENWLSLRLSALAPRTIESYRDLIGRLIGPALGGVDVAALTAARIQSALLVPLCDAGHARTAQLCLLVLRSALALAVDDGLIPRNPAARILPPRHAAADPRWWTPEELRQFVGAAAASPWALAWLLALTCGLRRGELAGLRWSDVDFQHAVLHICNQRERVKGRGVIDCPPKSAAGRRSIPLPAVLAPHLRLQQRRQRAQACGGGVVPVYVLSYQDNRPIDPHRLDIELSATIRRAGVRPINLHGLRHTMATLATSCGVPLKVLQSLLGHSSITVTAKTYAHVLTPDQISAVDAVAARVML